MEVYSSNLISSIISTDRAEDIFGDTERIRPPEHILKGIHDVPGIEKTYSRLKQEVSAEALYEEDPREAEEQALSALSELHDSALRRIPLNLYGFKSPRPVPNRAKSFAVGDRRYFVGSKLLSTEADSTFGGWLEFEGQTIGEVLITIANSDRGNERLENEKKILDILHDVHTPHWMHLPLILNRFTMKDKVGLVSRRLDAFSLTEVREHPQHRDGVDQKDVVWMLDRFLGALVATHASDIVHRNLAPENLFIQWQTHNGIISGWKDAVVIDNRRILGGSELECSPYIAPEVLRGSRPGPWSDLYSLGKSMIWLLGGDPEANAIPVEVKEPLRNFLLSLVEESPGKRPLSSLAAYEELISIKEKPLKFRHFDMSGSESKL
jgi:hypothetical protein